MGVGYTQAAGGGWDSPKLPDKWMWEWKEAGQKYPGKGFFLYWEDFEMVGVSKLRPAWVSSSMQSKKQVREGRRCVVAKDSGGCFCSVASLQRSLREFLSAGQEKVKAQVFSSGPPRLFRHWKPNLKYLTSKDFLIFSFKSAIPERSVKTFTVSWLLLKVIFLSVAV